MYSRTSEEIIASFAWLAREGNERNCNNSMNGLDNPNPEVRVLSHEQPKALSDQTFQERIFDMIRDIRDPEHPRSLEELSVIHLDSISITDPSEDSPGYGTVSVWFTLSVPNCSIIGLSQHPDKAGRQYTPQTTGRAFLQASRHLR